MDAVNKSAPGGGIRIGGIGLSGFRVGWRVHRGGFFLYKWASSLGRGNNVNVNRVIWRKKGGTKRRTKRNRESYYALSLIVVIRI